MGNKQNFDRVKYKTLLTEAVSRMTIRRGKKVNQLYKDRDKIVNFVKSGDMNSALIYIDNYINEENKLKAYDALCTMCEQMKGRVAEVESYGVTDDLSANANAIVYASHRLDIKELEKLSVVLKDVMPKVEFKEAMNGTCINETVRDNISYRKCEKGEAYLKLIEVCRETETQCIIKEEWKKVLREYCYKNQIDYPYSAEEDLGYNPGVDVAPAPAHGGGFAPAPYGGGSYGPSPGGYAPAPMYQPTGPAIYPGGGMPPPQYASPAPGEYYSNPDVPPSGFGAGDAGAPSGMPPAGAPTGGFSSGYSLPPPPSDLGLPKYGMDTKKPDTPEEKKPAPRPAPEKKAPAKKPVDDDDSDDEDLMARLRNLQK